MSITAQQILHLFDDDDILSECERRGLKIKMPDPEPVRPPRSRPFFRIKDVRPKTSDFEEMPPRPRMPSRFVNEADRRYGR